MTAATAPALAADLDSGLRRLKLGTMRRMAPELMVTAKTQRWSPEEFLRTLLDAEITSRDESNARARMKAAAFPVSKRSRSSTSPPPRSRRRPLTTWPRWNGSGPRRTTAPSARPGQGNPTAWSRSASPPSRPVARSATSPPPSSSRPSTAAWPTTPSAASSRTCSATTWSSSTKSGFAPLDDTGAQLLFRFVAAAYERRALGIGSHWPFDQWGRFLPEHTTAVSLLDRLLHHAVVVVTEGESFRMRQARTKTGGRLTKN